MQPTFSELKKAAKSALKKHWIEAITICMLVLAVIFTDVCFQYTLMSVFTVDAVWSLMMPFALPDNGTVASMLISVFSSAYWLCVIMPLSLGALRWFWKITGGSDVGIKEAFYFFSSGKEFRRSLLLSVSVFLRLVLAAFIAYLPGMVAGMLSEPDVYAMAGLAMPLGLIGLSAVRNVLDLIGTVALLIWALRYVLFFPVFFEEPEMSVGEVLKGSVSLTAGGKIRFIAFSLSFILLYLACIFVVPAVFIIPFFFASLCIYGREEYRFYKFKLENGMSSGVSLRY